MVDNSSTDETPEIATRYSDRLVTAGPERSAQRNLGARLAKGSYLLFLDADMELTPEVVRSCVQRAAECDALIVPERTMGKSWLARTRDLERSSYAGSFLYEAARFVSKTAFDALGGYNVEMTGPEDYDFEARLEAHGFRVGHVQEPVLHHEEGITLAQHLRKRAYYGKSLGRYTEAHPDRGRIQFGPTRLLYYARHLGSSPWALAQVLLLKSMEYAASSARVIGSSVSREDVY